MEERVITAVNCMSGIAEELTVENGSVKSITEGENRESNLPFVGPGLVDLQINGVNGIDFNDPSLTEQDVKVATYYLLSKGVTSFFPTVITNSDENISTILHTIYKACLAEPIVNDCIYGIHIEGPFLSSLPGAKGAHDEQYIKAPDWELFKKFQEAAGGKIKLITLAPEWEGANEFIEKCRQHNVIVSIGHSMADADQISAAAKAGATLSTHLGNAVPLLLPRHPNMLWAQLAEEELYTCIIADGIHIPDSFIKVVMKNKGEKTLVVSDATCFAGMLPGEYQNHIGGTVVLDSDKRVSLKSTPGLLAGAAKTLLENVETLVAHQLAPIGEAWKMASANVAAMLVKNDPGFQSNGDSVIFRLVESEIQVQTVIKSGKIVFEQ